MLRIDGLKLPPGADDTALRAACARALRIRGSELLSVRLLRRSIDAREGVRLVCSAAAATVPSGAPSSAMRFK